MTEEERAGIDMAAKIGLTIEFNTYHSKTYYSTWIKANEYRFPEHCYRIKPNDERT